MDAISSFVAANYHAASIMYYVLIGMSVVFMLFAVFRSRQYHRDAEERKAETITRTDHDKALLLAFMACSFLFLALLISQGFHNELRPGMVVETINLIKK